MAHETDWLEPPWDGKGRPVAVDEARRDLPFDVHVPAGLGDGRIYLSPGQGSNSLMAVYFVYQHSTYGIVWVGQSFPDVPNEAERIAGYEASVAHSREVAQAESIEPWAEIVTIRGGAAALLGVNDTGAIVEWVENGLQFVVRGPALTRSQVLEIVEKI